MKIKTTLVLIIITVIFDTQIHAQGTFITVGGGYGYCGAPVQPITNYSGTANNNGSGYTNNYNLLKGSGSYGKGIQASGTLGYMFSENLGAELSIGYLHGGKFIRKESDISSTYISINEISTYGRMLRFTPALRMSVGKGKIRPYMRMGLVIGVGAKLTVDSIRKYDDLYLVTNGSWETVTKYSGGISLGFASGLGADFKCNERYSFYMELGFITQSWAPEKSLITKYLDNGVNELSTFTTYQKETEYLDNYTEDTGSFDSSVPQKQLKFYFPFSSVGINVGLHISLGGKK